MATSRPKRITLKLDALRSDVTEFRNEMVSFSGTASARWARTIRWVGAREGIWRTESLITDGAFDYAVAMLNREFGSKIDVGGELSSHLMELCHPNFDRRLRSVWSRAISNVLKGHLTYEEAAELGVTATAAQTKQTAATTAKAKAKAKLSDFRDEEDGPNYRLPTRAKVIIQTRKRMTSAG